MKTKRLYRRLAWQNIKNGRRLYLPYTATSGCVVAMFFVMDTMRHTVGDGWYRLEIFMQIGSVLLGFFGALFLLYTTSFLMKRRRSELGLYSVLGMERRHIARVVLWENLYTGVCSLVGGLAGGLALNSLARLLLRSLMGYEVVFNSRHFAGFSGVALQNTLFLFTGLFFLCFLVELTQLHRLRPVELLRASRQGEREPKSQPLLALIGLAATGAGYWLSLRCVDVFAVAQRQSNDFLQLCVAAVVLVIIGTFALFTAGSVAVLKALRRNRRFYYKARHFTAVSGMLYRMKQNAAGLASICVMATGVMLMLSTTGSLYLGAETALYQAYPRQYTTGIFMPMGVDDATVANCLRQYFSQQGYAVENPLLYRSVSLGIWRPVGEGGQMQRVEGDIKREDIWLSLTLQQEGQAHKLAPGEVGAYSTRGAPLGGLLRLGDTEIPLVHQYTDPPAAMASQRSFWHAEYCLVAADQQTLTNLVIQIQQIPADSVVYNSLSFCYDLPSLPEKYPQGEMPSQVSDFLALSFSDAPQRESLDSILQQAGIEGEQFILQTGARGMQRAEYYTLYGGLLFLGIFVSALFLMATALTIYYKQINEGYDDRRRFQTMRQVGMSEEEIKRSVRTQVRMVLFLPLVTACIHMVMAFPMLLLILQILGLYSTGTFVACAVGSAFLFAVFYALVYWCTSQVYYKIVQ